LPTRARARSPARARKRFGQHFLHDRGIIRRILEAIAPAPGEHLVEIGPGRGALTGALLAACGRLDAIEIDRDLAALLRTTFAAEAGFVLHETDALEFDWTALAAQRGGPLRLVGNLPYNISTPLLFRLLAADTAILDMHFMLQKEVVDRILATPGSADYGRLTVMLAPFVSATRVLSVGPGAFQPPPRVQSAVVRLVRRTQLAPWAHAEQYGRVVAAAFGQRRKTLRNALASLLSDAQIAALGIDPGARAETLEPAQFGALAQAAGSVIH
jgi:16S rRNA (adenine1518-N6/adenine1519-N6)-dimethyltransferase